MLQASIRKPNNTYNTRLSHLPDDQLLTVRKYLWHYLLSCQRLKSKPSVHLLLQVKMMRQIFLCEEQDDQDIEVLDEHYQGRWDSNMMADYCWALRRDIQEAEKLYIGGLCSCSMTTINKLFIQSFLIFTFNSSRLMCL